ncbi:MAG TPA: Ldh family oxidoreductase [Clostridiaceae bacterium]
MVKVKLLEIEEFISNLFCKSGLNKEDVKTATEVFMRATIRGVGHHDIHDLPGRLASLEAGKINAKPSIKLLHQYAGLENYEGDNCLGEIGAMFVMNRAEQLADEHGIGLCTIRNTNHILACSPYPEKASEDGYIGYIITRAAPSMGAPDRKEKVIGASPMSYAAPTNKGYPIMFDACLAYASFGVLSSKIKAGESVPPYWGLDAEGNQSTDPAAIAKGTRLPIGGHKGFGLTILGEIITGILSEGQIIDEPQPVTGAIGKPTHTAICIKADGLMSLETFKDRTSEMIDRMESRAVGLQIPGQHSAKNKEKIKAAGTIELTEDLIEELNKWALKLGVAPVL